MTVQIELCKRIFGEKKKEIFMISNESYYQNMWMGRYVKPD